MDILTFSNCKLDPKLGAGKIILRFTEQLTRQGHHVTVEQPHDYTLWQGQSRAIKFRMAGGAWRIYNAWLKKQPYDLIEFYGDDFWPVSWQLSRRAKRPLLVAHTNGLELLLKEREASYEPPRSLPYRQVVAPAYARLSRLAFKSADAFVALCELDRQYVVDHGFYPAERTAVVEPGLDPVFLGLPLSLSRPKRVAYTGTWIVRKGIRLISAVMSKLLIQDPELTFYAYGTGLSEEAVQADFPAAVRDRVKVYPKLDGKAIAEGLQQAQVFFFPSQFEGFGLALAEAMACGCACVTTPTGYGAALKDQQEALVCDFEDVTAMAAAIARLLAEPDFRYRIAEAGYKRVQALSWESSAKKLAETYAQWLAQPSSFRSIRK